jgi:hypothetical protein
MEAADGLQRAAKLPPILKRMIGLPRRTKSRGFAGQLGAAKASRALVGQGPSQESQQAAFFHLDSKTLADRIAAWQWCHGECMVSFFVKGHWQRFFLP